MKIIVEYKFQTDGDWKLRNPDNFNIMNNDDDEDIIGNITFENKDIKECKKETKDFLKELLCDIQVYPQHYYVIKYMYNLIMLLLTAIDKYKEGECFIYKTEEKVVRQDIEGRSSGNYADTYIELKFSEK